MLIKRIISSVLIILFTALAISIDWLCGLTVTALIIAGLYEFFTMLEKRGISIYKYFGIGLGAVIPLSLVYRFELTRNWEFLFVVMGILFLILMQFRRRQNTGVIVGISTTIFGILYISWFLSFLIRIRYLPQGALFITALLLMTKLGDIGAYLIGSRFGKTPFMPRISPKKTIEGAIGGLLFSVLGALASRPFLGFSYINILLVGFSLGILGQLGDLSESLMKRDCQIKDSGGAFPGLGGVLDIMDSLIFTAPVFYFYINTLVL
ncbi:MAG: phosphatidate cytidylyltransferase [Candidatus Omnitrophica bacterium]|nr:phosphatidate cytidylyltransferase [Candidatus Omnitrophota bacterium]